MPVRPRHDIEHALDVLDRHVLVKEVAHRVHEDRLRLPPPKGQLQHVRLEGEREPVPIIRLPHRLQPLGHPLGVAVLAPGTDLVTPRHRVPGRLRPLDFRSVSHGQPSCGSSPLLRLRSNNDFLPREAGRPVDSQIAKALLDLGLLVLVER